MATPEATATFVDIRIFTITALTICHLPTTSTPREQSHHRGQHRLPRSSADQYEAGRPVDLEEAQPGDLLFFATGGGHRVSHVALYLGHGAFIHAPSEGRRICEDRMDERYYRETFLGARTYL